MLDRLISKPFILYIEKKKINFTLKNYVFKSERMKRITRHFVIYFKDINNS